jgi:hypothetical protein
MWRGTTPTNTFSLPDEISVDDFNVIFLTYSQYGRIVFEVGMDRMSIAGHTIQIVLTQAETLQFVPGAVQIQMRGRMKDGRAIASNVITTTAKEVLKDGEI